MYKKVLGLFRCMPIEVFTLERVCNFTNSNEKEVQPILDRLRKEGNIKGVRKMKLSGELLKNYKKNCKPPQ
tara:strand:- start:909 stop:1121 length:213 start_codon:yes stop_codon:yes gene_type:complete